MIRMKRIQRLSQTSQIRSHAHNRGALYSNNNQWSGRLGCHVSIRQGYAKAAHTARSIGASSFQYFPKNPRSLSVKRFDPNDAEQCKVYCMEHDLQSIAHTSYPVNLAVSEPTLRKAVIESLLNDLDIAEACGSIGVVVHFGKYKGEDLLQGYHVILSTLNEVLAEWNGNAMLLIENQAGDGAPMGTQLEELVQIRALCDKPEAVGFCFDTCHAFASGLWNERNVLDLIQKGHDLGYAEHLKAVHCNDSVYSTRSFKDRHAIVGKGTIGEERMLAFLTSSWMGDIPIVLETPTSAGYSHQDQIEMLRSLLNAFKGGLSDD